MRRAQPGDDGADERAGGDDIGDGDVGAEGESSEEVDCDGVDVVTPDGVKGADADGSADIVDAGVVVSAALPVANVLADTVVDAVAKTLTVGMLGAALGDDTRDIPGSSVSIALRMAGALSA